jgi:hypothetical protein
MGEFFESAAGGAVWGLGFGLASLALTGFGRGLRPLAKSVVKGGIVASDWLRNVTAESRESLRDIYEEARAESDGLAAAATTESAGAKTE